MFKNLLLGHSLKKVLLQQFTYYFFCVEIEIWKNESNKRSIALEKVKMQ